MGGDCSPLSLRIWGGPASHSAVSTGRFADGTRRHLPSGCSTVTVLSHRPGGVEGQLAAGPWVAGGRGWEASCRLRAVLQLPPCGRGISASIALVGVPVS